MTTTPTTTEEPAAYIGELPRGAEAAPCVCNGYADKVEATEAEDAEHGCGRPKCCCGAFKCRLCGKRLVARFPAPELE